MSKTKILVLGGFMAALAFILQGVPVFFSEALTLVTMLSTLPVYIISRINPKAGLMCFLSACVLIMTVSIHECVIFFFMNGPVGLCLGICSHYRRNLVFSTLVTGVILAASLVFVSFVIGIPVFGTPLPGTFWAQLSIMLIFSLAYSFIYRFAAGLIFKLAARATRSMPPN